MRGKKILTIFFILIITSQIIIITAPLNVKSKEPLFAITILGDTFHYHENEPDYAFFVRDQLMRIGINVDIIVWDSVFPGIDFWDFDNYFHIIFIKLEDIKIPNYYDFYGEKGIKNISGYNTTLDFDAELGTGINEWYLKTAQEFMAPNSIEKKEHYYEWQNYLMDKILPVYPLTTPSDFCFYWLNLKDFNFSKGLIQSWGKMNFIGTHTGQIKNDNFLYAIDSWETLNPLRFNYPSEQVIIDAILDPLFWQEFNGQIYPHLARELEHINKSHIRIYLREGINWQVDPDNSYPEESFDVKDVYFTLYCLKHLSDNAENYYWLKDMKIIDKYTLDIFIDQNPLTMENEPDPNYLYYLTEKILPEHYLNQSQLIDGKTPDIAHPSWNTFTSNPFGTGLFRFENHIPGIETQLKLDLNSWFLNHTLTSDTNLNWIERFGSFNEPINNLRLKLIINGPETINDFEAGKIDMIDGLTNQYLENTLGGPKIRDYYLSEPWFEFETKPKSDFSCLAFNLREKIQPIGNTTPCDNDASISKGLAIRKAISYALDKVEMNKIINGGEHQLLNHPVYPTSSYYCNPDIIKYEHDLEKAKYFMELAGYSYSNTQTIGIGFNIYYFIMIFLSLSCFYFMVSKRSEKKQL